MSEMLTDLLQNIYGRISSLGKAIQNLQHSIDNLNETLTDKVENLVGSINSMTDSVEKEGETNQLIFKSIGESAVSEIKLLQEKIGLKDIDEVLENLTNIVQSSKEALNPKTVDILLHEVISGIKELKEGPKTSTSDEKDKKDKKDEKDKNLQGDSNKSKEKDQEQEHGKETEGIKDKKKKEVKKTNKNKSKKTLNSLGPPPGNK